MRGLRRASPLAVVLIGAYYAVFFVAHGRAAGVALVIGGALGLTVGVPLAVLSEVVRRRGESGRTSGWALVAGIVISVVAVAALVVGVVRIAR